MDTVTFLIVALVVWILGAIFTMMASPFGTEDHDIIWWPLTLVKFLWRTFWRALSRDWRP